MVPSFVRSLALAAGLFLAVPALASAQIYTWRDSAGNLVLSNKPRSGATQTYAVLNTPGTLRTTRPVLSRRARAYEPLITEYADVHDVRPELVRAVIQAESGFDPSARSPKGAMGLMQLMPATASELGVRDPYDPEQNIRGGVAYLKSLLLKYGHNEELALAAYNAGPAAVEKYGTIPPYRETRNYIARIKGETAGTSGQTSRPVRRHVEIVDGREVVTFTSKRKP